jgi:SWI/SNF-related matrix-associated actin-dependent regulator 1 of chromatin subfamily A
MGKTKITTAYEILEEYSGKNPYISVLSSQYKRGGKVLSDFEVQYIIKNKDYKPVDVNKTIGITKELGEKLYEKHNLAFVPEKIKVTRIIGEMGDSYHAYFLYRQSEGAMLGYLPRKGLMGKLIDIDWKSVEIDFDKYDNHTAPFKLREHQKDGIKFMFANKKCICADEMGVGKSCQAIVYSLETGVDHVLIISPASLKTNWKKECMRYVDEKDIQIINGRKWREDVPKFTIINYEIVQNFYEVAEEPVFETVEVTDASGIVVETYKKPVMVKKNGKLVQKMQKSKKKSDIAEALKNSPLFMSNFDCVIIDEAQKLSNKGSIRYKTIQDFLKKSNPNYVTLLTGTPLTNNPMNLYNILNLIGADITKDYRYYTKRFMDAKEHKKRDGGKYVTFGQPQNLDELRDKIKDCYIRRLTTDVGVMVEKKVSRRYFDFTDKQREEYSRLWNDYVKAQEGYDVSLGSEYSDFWSDYELEDELEKNRKLIEGSLIRQFFGREMVEHTIDVVNEFIEDGEKVVVFTSFQKEMDMLMEYYGKKAVCYNGKMSIKQKDEAQDAFNNNKEVVVFVGNIVASGVGLSLPVACKSVFNNFDWVFSSNVQAESRIHRLTQTRDVECIYMLFNDSISEEMFNKVIYKGYLMEQTIKSENQK